MSALSDTEVFSAAFPGNVTRIFQMRDADRKFDDVCNDFVLLVRQSRRTLQIDPAFEDSLVELKQEIETALLQASTVKTNEQG